MADILSQPFMLRALGAGLLIAVLGAWYGTFLVQRRLAFLGAGLSHAAFGGVALGIFLNAEPLWIAVPFTVFVALAMVWLEERTRLAGDTVVGMIFAVSMAGGIVLLSKTPRFSQDAFAYLFGSILSVSAIDLVVTGSLVVLTLAMWPMWGRWAFATFDRELARSEKLNVRRDDYILVSALAVTIVVAAKVVGVVLVAAFLIIPAAAGRLMARTLAGMTMMALSIGTVSVAAGMAASVWLDVPSGAAIVLTQALLFAGIVVAAMASGGR